MKQFILGLVIGSALTGTLVGAGQFYNKQGQPSAPAGSVQSFDYYRQRQQWIDIGHMRQQADQDRLNQMTKPCAR